MNTNNDLERIFFLRLVALYIFLRCGFDLYHDVKLYGLNYSDILNIAILFCVVISLIIDFVYKKIRKSIPKVITIVILAIPIGAYIFDLCLNVKRLGFSYITIAGISIPIYLAFWYIIMLAYVKKGRDIPKVIRIIPPVILFSFIIIMLILSSI